MKIQSIGVYPQNNIGNQVVIHGSCEGDYSLLNKLLLTETKSLDRQKISYIYKVETETGEGVYYKYNLTKDEHAQAVKFITDFK